LREKQNIPADGCGWHGRDNPGAHASEETSPAEPTLNYGGSVEQTARRANLLAFGEATGLQKSLHDVEGRGDTGGKGTGKTAGHAVGEGVVLLGGVHHLGDGFIGDKLGGSEGDGHAEGGWVGDVEGLETFSAIEGFGALHQGLVNRSVNLHTLLDDCFGVSSASNCLILPQETTYHRMGSSAHH